MTPRSIKLLHTVVWAILAGCIFALAPLAWAGRFNLVLVITVAVLVETLVLALNRWNCPLTPLAARYTSDREPNFDIDLPRWRRGL